MHQQRSCDSEWSLLLLVQQYRPSTGTFDPDHSRQWESIQELAQRHETAAGTRGLGGRLSRARQRVLAGSGGLAARQRRKFTTRWHRGTVSLSQYLVSNLLTVSFYIPMLAICVSRCRIKIFDFKNALKRLDQMTFCPHAQRRHDEDHCLRLHDISFV